MKKQKKEFMKKAFNCSVLILATLILMTSCDSMFGELITEIHDRINPKPKPKIDIRDIINPKQEPEPEPTPSPRPTPNYPNPNTYYPTPNTYYPTPSTYYPTPTHETTTPESRYIITEVNCSLCKGKGWIVGSDALTFGEDGTKWCEECHAYVHLNHSHDRCPSCGGSGKVTEGEWR